MTTRLRLIDVSSLPSKADAADLPASDVVGIVNNALNTQPFIDKFVTSSEFDSFLNGDTEEKSKSYFLNIDSVAPLPSSGVVIVAGRPGHGKSSLMRNIALRKAENKEKVVYITYEFNQQKEVLNFIATKEGKPITRSEARNTKSYVSIMKLLGHELLITHKIKTIEEIKSFLLQDEYKGATVFIDYIQKVPSSTFSGDTSGSEAHIRHVCNVLNDLYITQNLLLIVGSQLTQSNGGSPTMDVVKGARAIEEVASVVYRIWRHGVSESSMLHDMVFKKGDYDFTIDVLKNRESVSGQRLGLYIVGGLSLSDTKPLINVK